MLKLLNSCVNYTHKRLAKPCFLCGARSLGQLLCPGCIGDLPRLPEQHCPICALPTPLDEVCGACLKYPPAFDRTVVTWQYAFPASVLVQQLKYGGELALAPWLAERLADELNGAELPDIIIPMPLHANRLRQRGFNQAALLAGHLSKRLDLAVDLGACRRIRDTPPQVDLPLKSRRGNIRNAFRCDMDLSGKRIALVDDVMTSGSSLDELARVVKRAGAREVAAWVVARTVPR